MSRLRSQKTTHAYKEYQKSNAFISDSCPLCSKTSIIEFNYWRIVNNNFPYDLIAEVHHMILPKQHMKEEGLSLEEYRELINIKDNYLNENYTHIIEALPKTKSIPEHFHLHLIKEKP